MRRRGRVRVVDGTSAAASRVAQAVTDKKHGSVAHAGKGAAVRPWPAARLRTSARRRVPAEPSGLTFVGRGITRPGMGEAGRHARRAGAREGNAERIDRSAPTARSCCTADRERRALILPDLLFSLADTAPKIGYAALGTVLCRS